MYTAIEPLAAQIQVADRRRALRSEVSVDTLMSDREGALFGVRLLNVSANGFMGVTDVDQCERALVRIDLPLVGWVRAELVWVLGNRVGAAFRDPIAQAVLDLLQHQARQN